MKKAAHILRSLFPLLVSLLLCSGTSAQVFAYFSSGVFTTPQQKAFAETYLTIHGPSLFAKDEGGLYHNSVIVEVKITKDSNIVSASKYNLNGPAFAKSAKAPAFLDIQRYPLPNGDYRIEVNISDNYSIRKKTLTIQDSLHVHFEPGQIQLSSIEALETYSKTNSAGPLSKSGMNLYPYTINFYGEHHQQLTFYVETYNAATVLGADKSFVVTYYIESSSEHQVLSSFGAFKKMSAAEVNPLLAKIDLSTLGSGFYNLVVEVKDADNKVRATCRYPFQRQNIMMEVTTLQQVSEMNLEAEYFGHVNNADTLKMFVECLWPIADMIDKERIINHSVKKDPETMKRFVIDFWQRRAADTANPLKLWSNYYREVQKVMVLFKCGKQPGYYSERGRVYLQYGAPNQRSQQLNEVNTFPYEIWQYYRTTDQTNGQFFSNRKFVFVNKQLGDDCFLLIHSDMKGEIYNPRWQFEITRRNNNGLADPDNVTPAGTEFNQMNEIYQNPR